MRGLRAPFLKSKLSKEKNWVTFLSIDLSGSVTLVNYYHCRVIAQRKIMKRNQPSTRKMQVVFTCQRHALLWI